MLEERMNRRPAAGTYFGHKTRNCHPYIMQSWVIDAYGNGCNEVYGADSTETQWGGQWIVNEGMRDRKEKKKNLGKMNGEGTSFGKVQSVVA